MTDEQRRALAKIRRCLALAADARGNLTERETAFRQAQVLSARHGFDKMLNDESEPAPAPAVPTVPDLTSPAWGPYWAQRSTEEARAHGLRSPVLCRDGHFVPG